MSLNWPKPGISHVPAYQVSAIPFITRSASGEVPQAVAGDITETLRVEFPFVTRFVVIKCADSSNALRVGVSALGVAGPASGQNTPTSYIELASGVASNRLEIKTKELFFAGEGGTSTFELLAGLTTIESSQLLTLTASNGLDGVG
jgi:hypothetical protein